MQTKFRSCCSKFIFDVEKGELKSIEESEPLELLTSELKYHPDTGNLFTLRGHYGALMRVPENEIKVWPGDKAEVNGKKTVLLPQHQLVIISTLYFGSFIKFKRIV